jgi:DNA primase
MVSDFNYNLSSFLENVDITLLISEYVHLKKMGDNLRGLCPFHSENTPSFYVSPKKGLFHCFGCGAAGNAISFVMKYHNFDFKDALEFIASKYGISLPAFNTKKNQFKDLFKLHEDFSILSKEYLFGDAGLSALNYLEKRGFDKNIIKDFELGYMPNDADFSSLLSKFSIKDIKTSGLFLMRKNGYVSRFNGRIIIPIKNIFGQIVAFSGRSITDEFRKYLNSPETPIFKKRELLYNLDRSKNLYDKLVYIAEGYFDVITLYQFDFTPALGVMGTALTLDHVKLIKKYFNEALLIFDGDNPGIKAAFRALDVFIKGDFIPSVVFLPEGDDPDSYLRCNQKGDFEKIIDNKQDLFIEIIRRLAKLATDNNKKVELIENLKQKLLNVKNPYRAELYVEEIATLVGVGKETLLKDIDLNKTKIILRKEQKKVVKYLCEYNFIRALFELPDDVINNLISDISEDYFSDMWIRSIYKKIIEIIEKGINIKNLINDIEVGEKLSSLLLDSLNIEDFYFEAVKNKNKIIYNWLTRKKREKVDELKSLSDNSKKQKLLLEINELINKQREINTYLLEG